jgi:uncharacterized membrane protein YjjP (DUF1212 family)
LQALSEQLRDGEIRVQLDSSELKAMQESQEKQRRQRFWLATAMTAVIAGTVVLTLGELPWLGWTLAAAGVVSGLVARR